MTQNEKETREQETAKQRGKNTHYHHNNYRIEGEEADPEVGVLDSTPKRFQHLRGDDQRVQNEQKCSKEIDNERGNNEGSLIKEHESMMKEDEKLSEK